MSCGEPSAAYMKSIARSLCCTRSSTSCQSYFASELTGAHQDLPFPPLAQCHRSQETTDTSVPTDVEALAHAVCKKLTSSSPNTLSHWQTKAATKSHSHILESYSRPNMHAQGIRKGQTRLRLVQSHLPLGPPSDLRTLTLTMVG